MSDYQNLVAKFNSCTLPKEKWTHDAHLIVAVWYCKTYELPKSLNLLRYHIKSFNVSVGTPNSDTQGYHETLTRFWLSIAAVFVKNNPDKSFEETAEAFVVSPWSSRNLALNYYSHEVLFSLKARKGWIESDLQKLPQDNETAFLLEKHHSLSDEEFAQQFSEKILNPEIFTHEAHLRLAWIMIKSHGLNLGSEMICHQILAFIKPFGAEEKFNTTLTVASMNLVHHFMQKVETDNFLDFIQSFPALKYDFKTLVSKHYSFDIIKDKRTKLEYVEPDLMEF
jgi:N-formylglutamate deformylase